MNASSSLGLEQVPMNEKTCLVGMGNTLRRDDAAGVYIVEEVGRRISGESLKTQVVEDVLEAYVFQLAELDCENIVIVDAIEASEVRESESAAEPKQAEPESKKPPSPKLMTNPRGSIRVCTFVPRSGWPTRASILRFKAPKLLPPPMPSFNPNRDFISLRTCMAVF